MPSGWASVATDTEQEALHREISRAARHCVRERTHTSSATLQDVCAFPRVACNVAGDVCAFPRVVCNVAGDVCAFPRVACNIAGDAGSISATFCRQSTVISSNMAVGQDLVRRQHGDENRRQHEQTDLNAGGFRPRPQVSGGRSHSVARVGVFCDAGGALPHRSVVPCLERFEQRTELGNVWVVCRERWFSPLNQRRFRAVCGACHICRSTRT